MKLVLFQDRQEVSSLNEQAVSVVRDLGLTVKKELERVHFAGVIPTRDAVYLSLPRNSVPVSGFGDLFSQSLIDLTASVIERYVRLGGLQVLAGEEGQVRRSLEVFLPAMILLRDYCRRGLYRKSVRAVSKVKGRVDWRRTISRELPSLGERGQPIYLETHRKVRSQDVDHPISQIHKQVLRELFAQWGWLAEFKSAARTATSELAGVDSNLSTTYAQTIVRSELTQAYQESDIRLLTSLLDYLSERRGRSSEGVVLGVQNFHHVWEAMLSEVIPGVVAVNHRLPKPAYKISDTGDWVVGKGMTTDIVSRAQDHVNVIDAKYYAARSPESAPGWPDVLKQVFYARAVRRLFSTMPITNSFVFPGAGGGSSSGPIASISVLDPSDGEHLDREYPPVTCLYIDPIEVMRAYVGRFKLADPVLPELLATH